MEKTFSEEEKLRRAIEISQRRNNYYNNNITSTRVNVNDKKDYKLFKKMILQIIICFLIYIIVYLINTTNYAFSDEVIKNINTVLNYDINIGKIYKNCQEFFITTFLDEKEEEKNIDNTITNNTTINVVSKNTQENILNNEKIVNNVISEKDEDSAKEQKKEEDKKEKTSMKLDAEKVMKLCKFQKPLSGTITSKFGEREATIKGMTTDHKGIDIAANSGTNIKSAIEGTVSVAEQNSEYGKFIKITNGDIMTVYAHCKKLKVKVGDKIKLGQTIATVGSTGNSTGPHLHFEIRYKNRYINPEYVIDF